MYTGWLYLITMALHINRVIIITTWLKVKYGCKLMNYVSNKHYNMMIIHHKCYSLFVCLKMNSSSVMVKKHDILL